MHQRKQRRHKWRPPSGQVLDSNWRRSSQSISQSATIEPHTHTHETTRPQSTTHISGDDDDGGAGRKSRACHCRRRPSAAHIIARLNQTVILQQARANSSLLSLAGAETVAPLSLSLRTLSLALLCHYFQMLIMMRQTSDQVSWPEPAASSSQANRRAIVRAASSTHTCSALRRKYTRARAQTQTRRR